MSWVLFPTQKQEGEEEGKWEGRDAKRDGKREGIRVGKGGQIIRVSVVVFKSNFQRDLPIQSPPLFTVFFTLPRKCAQELPKISL